MPVEINELLIKARVSESGQTAQNGGNTENGSVNEAALEPLEKAVKEIMAILKRKNER